MYLVQNYYHGNRGCVMAWKRKACSIRFLIMNFLLIPKTMQAIERSLLERCHNRKEPTEEECDQAAEADQLLPPYRTKNGARVTMSSSLDLLSW